MQVQPASAAFQLRSPIEWCLLSSMPDDDSYLTRSCPHINSLGVWDRRKLSWDAAGLGGHGQQCGHTQGHSSRDSMLVKPETENSKLTLKFKWCDWILTWPMRLWLTYNMEHRWWWDNRKTLSWRSAPLSNNCTLLEDELM